MATGAHLMVEGQVSVEGLVEEVAAALGVKFELKSDEYESWYEFQNSDLDITIGTHDFSNDGEARFEDYQYDITIYARRNGAPEEVIVERRHRISNELFESFKATNHYELMLVDGEQTVIAKYHPRVKMASGL